MPLAPALYVGTDISEAMNRTRFLDPGGTEVGRGFSSANDLPGSEALADEAMRRARTIEATEIRWGLEATNLFWWHLATYLTTNPELLAGGLRCWVFNPRQVAGFKEAYGDLGKGDWVDALVIADRLRFGRLPAECYLDERYQPLQRLTRHRRHLVKTLVREKQVALGYVYLKLSAYNLAKPLADTFGATSQVLLSDYLTPDEIVAAPLEDLAAVIARESRGRVADPGEVAEAVKQAARRSYRLPARMVEPVNLVLSSSLATIRTLGAQLKPMDKAIAAELGAVPPQTVDTVPGLGPVFTAGHRGGARRRPAVRGRGVRGQVRRPDLAPAPVRGVRGGGSPPHQDRERLPPLLPGGGGQLGPAQVPGVPFLLRPQVRRGHPAPPSPGPRAHRPEAGTAGRLPAAERPDLPASERPEGLVDQPGPWAQPGCGRHRSRSGSPSPSLPAGSSIRGLTSHRSSSGIGVQLH